MFEKIMGWLRPKPVVVREGALSTIAELLFPGPVEEPYGDGATIIIDRSIDGNLEAALIDLEDGRNDEVTRATIRSCVRKLIEARAVLEANHPISKKAHYLVVGAPDKIDDPIG